MDHVRVRRAGERLTARTGERVMLALVAREKKITARRRQHLPYFFLVATYKQLVFLFSANLQTKFFLFTKLHTPLIFFSILSPARPPRTAPFPATLPVSHHGATSH